ncbi:MAG: hypothetical protein M3083_17735 [Actinomycetota bacterium]|nr:hypothetical protein [Actinomycetota bacterium]
MILAARCVRDDTLRQARETTARTHPELRRYLQAGSSGAALFTFPGGDIGCDDFFMTDLMTNYSQAVIVEGDNPLAFVDLRVFVAPAPKGTDQLVVRRARDQTGGERANEAVLERLLREPSGVAELLEKIGGAPMAELARKSPELLEKLRAVIGEATSGPAPKPEKHWAIADRYRGIEHAQLAVVNISRDSDRQAAERLVAEVVRLRKDKELFDDILGFRGNRIPITAVVANLSDPDDLGWKKALARLRRVVRSRST